MVCGGEGGRPAVILWILQPVSLEYIREGHKGTGSRAPPGWLPSPSQSSGKARLSHMHFMFSCGKIPLGGLRVKESQQVFMEALKHSLGVLLCCWRKPVGEGRTQGLPTDELGEALMWTQSWCKHSCPAPWTCLTEECVCLHTQPCTCVNPQLKYKKPKLGRVGMWGFLLCPHNMKGWFPVRGQDSHMQRVERGGCEDWAPPRTRSSPTKKTTISSKEKTEAYFVLHTSDIECSLKQKNHLWHELSLYLGHHILWCLCHNLWFTQGVGVVMKNKPVVFGICCNQFLYLLT